MPTPPARAGAGDFRFRLTAGWRALLVLLIFAGVIASLVIGAMPAFKAFGFGFIIDRGLEPDPRTLRRPGARSTAPWSPHSSPC